MNFVALKMLTGDRAKYLGLIFAIAFSSFLIAHQASIFARIMDEAGYRFFFPNHPLELGKALELNDHRVRIVGISNASAPFTTFPVLFTRYSQALGYVGRERNLLSFVLARPEANAPVAELTK